jgi:hypothetical protein
VEHLLIAIAPPQKWTTPLGEKVAAFRRGSWQRRIRNPWLIALGALAGCLGATLPAKAYVVYFNAPNVLGGIRGCGDHPSEHRGDLALRRHPYVNTSGATVVNISYSGKECQPGYYWDGSKCVYLSTPTTNLPIPHRLLSPRLTSMPIDQITVWADLNYSSPPVPAPLPLAGGGSVEPEAARRAPELVSLGNGAQR